MEKLSDVAFSGDAKVVDESTLTSTSFSAVAVTNGLIRSSPITLNSVVAETTEPSEALATTTSRYVPPAGGEMDSRQCPSEATTEPVWLIASPNSPFGRQYCPDSRWRIDTSTGVPRLRPGSEPYIPVATPVDMTTSSLGQIKRS